MKLFKSDDPKRRKGRLINDFQYAIQSGDYWSARKAIEQALQLDPQNEKLHEMKRMTLELITMQDEQRGVSRGHATGPKMAKADIPEQIEKLAKLKERGIMTDAEFQSKKQELLSRI